MVLKNLLPLCGEYSCHRQGYTWQTKQHFQTCPSTISGGQPLGISKRMKITLPWQNCFTAPSAFYRGPVVHDNVHVCSCMSLPSGRILCSLPRLISQESPRGDGHEQRRRSSSCGVEFSDFLDKPFHTAPLPGTQSGHASHCIVSSRNCWERGKHLHSRPSLCPWKSAGTFLEFVPSSSKGLQLKSGTIRIASGLQFFYFITVLSLFNAQGSGIKIIILKRVLLKLF